ncbi:MAG: hypothetical protein ACKV2U_01425 [Bryobacteraceae bacterium]
MTYLDTIRQRYPKALSTGDSVDRMFDILKLRLQLAPSQLMSADSICSDDLNSIEYPKRAYEMLGPFKMGGLNGFPFTGLTGMGAFAHHVPVDGAVFVFYAPHIGITRGGAVGEILRPGQAAASACCGAAKAAIGKLFRGEITPGHITELDYQQNTIEQIFLANEKRIRAAAEPIAEATEAMYKAIEDRIDLLAERTKYQCRFLILVGGILINADYDEGSFVEVRRFHAINLATCERTDLSGELYR